MKGENVLFSWQPSVDTGSGLDYYELKLGQEVKITPTADEPNVVFVPSKSYRTNINEKTINAVDEGLTDGVYYWWVQAVDKARNSSSSEVRWVTLDTPPAAPVVSLLTQIPDGWYKSKGSLTFTWTPPYDKWGIAGYSYVFDNESSTEPDSNIDITDNVVTIHGVLDGTWYFHIKAIDEGGNWGKTRHMEVKIPNPFKVVYPVNGGFVTDNTPTLTWSAALYVDDPMTISIRGPEVSITKTRLTSPSYEISEAEALPDNTYTWRVGTWLWSKTWQFVVDTDSTISSK